MTLEDAGGELEVLQPKHPRTALAPSDVWYHSWQAGAGFGDPLDRDPEAVAADVRNLAVSPATAADVYGVVVEDGRLDADATDERRAALRRARVDGEPKPQGRDVTTGRLVGDGLVVTDDGVAHCSRCGEHLGAEGAVGARSHAHVLETSLDPAGPHRGQDYGDLGFRLRRCVCPGCGSQFHAELVYRGDRLVAPPNDPVEAVRYVRPVDEVGR
jgi:N-methylhydantoinase B